MLICSNSYLLVDHVVFCILVPFRRDIIKRKIFFFQGPTVLTPGTWTNCRLIILWRYVVQMLICGMTRFGLFVIGALWISTPKMYKLRCLYYTFWPQIGSNYSASSFEFVINSFCFLECRESPKCFHIPLKACKLILQRAIDFNSR